MKKLILSVTMLAIAASTIFVACKKGEEKQTANSITKSISATSRTAPFALNFNSVDIGELHNQTVIALYNGVDITNIQTAELALKNNFASISYDPSALGFTRSAFNQASSDIVDSLKNCNFDLRNWNSPSINNEASYPYVVQVLDAIDNIVSVENFNSNLNAIQLQATNNLSQADLEVVIATIEVAKKSASLWLPLSMGGLGYYENIFGPFPPIPNNPNPSELSDAVKNLIKNVIIGDASAVSASFLKLGTMIAIGMEVPGANVAILVGIALDAAYGSAFSALLP